MNLNKLYKVLILGFVGFNATAQEPPISLPVERVEPGKVEKASPAPTVSPKNTMLYQGPEGLSQKLSQLDSLSPEEIEAQYNKQFKSQPVDNVPKFLKEVEKNYKPTQSYTLNPSDNIVVPVSRGLMNSIKTNFGTLAVRTSDDKAVLEVENGFLYATLKSSDPVGLILYEDGVLESQVSITLVPINAPPAMVNVDVKLSQKMKEKAQQYQQELAKQEAMEQANQERKTYQSEHQKRVVNLLMPVAQGDFPRGFSMTNDIPPYHTHPCRMAIEHTAMQRLTGGREIIDVVLVKNTSPKIYQVREEMCIDNDTIAVALFERSYLKPGQEMELYIVRDRYYQERTQRTKRRPRLTGGE